MNGFEKHGIDHSSASQINMFASAPCAWVARYLLDKRFKFSNAARAGVIVEQAVVNVIARGWPIEKAVAEAEGEYNKALAFGASDADRRRGDAIAGMIAQAVEALQPYGKPEIQTISSDPKGQRRVEVVCNGDNWRLPVIGYLDFYFPEHGLVIDLKTTMQMPSAMSDEHTRQGAIYRFAMGNCAVKFLYVTGKKHSFFDIDNPAPVLSEIKSILNRQERFLRRDIDEIVSSVPVISGSYYWSGDEQLRKEIYGI